MPIKERNKHKYPDNFRWIRAAVIERSDNRCEGSPAYPDCRAENGRDHPVTGSRVVLTTAHLDHRPEHCDGMEDLPMGPIDQELVPAKEDSNLRSWCQRCHLTYDAKHHAKNGAETKRVGGAIESLFDMAKFSQVHWKKTPKARETIVSNLVVACERFLMEVMG